MRFLAAPFVLTLLLASAKVHAQVADAPDAIVPPRVIRAVPAEPPAPPSHPVRVVLELVIDETGRVTDARVVQSGGELDAAALEAARHLEFDPARRGGAPVPAVIRYAYDFEPPEEDEPPQASPPEASPPVAPFPAPTPPAPTPTTAVDAEAPSSREPLEFEATATVEAPPREVTRRRVDATIIRKAAGTRGDVLRTVELLPGVGRSYGDPILRGAAPHESKTFLNGTPVPFLYHFGGLTSFVSPHLVERVELYPGNFSVRYGRSTGGVVEVKLRDPDAERLRAIVDLNFIDSSAFVETPLGERAGIAAAVRRSNIDFFFENFVPEDAYSVLAAPVYLDYQAIAKIDLGHDFALRLLGYGSRDAIELFLDEALDDPYFAGGIGGLIEYHRAGVELEAQKPWYTLRLGATLGWIRIEQRIGEFWQEVSGPELHARAELSFDLDPSLRLTLGGDASFARYGGSYRGPHPPQLEGNTTATNPQASAPVLAIEKDTIPIGQSAATVELSYRPMPKITLVPGVRLDVFSDIGEVTVDPRLAVRYDLAAQTTLKWGVGWFTQPPEYYQSMPEIARGDVDPFRAIQGSAGIEQRFGDAVEVGVEGFYKRLEGLIVSTGAAEPVFSNDGSGRAYGAELSGRARWAEASFAQLAYTLSRSERRDANGGYRPFEFDQTHVLSLAASQNLGGGWHAGLRFRLVSGNPQTPITGSVYDARTGVYVPTYGEPYGARRPTLHQLDVRLEKTWKLGPVALAAYLDVQNVYDHRSREGERYSYDYSQKEAVLGSPVLPSLGVRGEL